MRRNRLLKWLLIVQSFMPLFILLFIKYYDGRTWDLVIKFFRFAVTGEVATAVVSAVNHGEFLRFVLLLLCVIMITGGVLIFFCFNKIQTAGFTDRAERISVKNDTTELSAAFFISYVVPMLLDDVTDKRGFICFLVLMVLLILLMRNTNLYYQNPILAILGYKTFEFQFTETGNRALMGKEYVGIVKGTLDETRIIKRKYIADNVFVICNKN